MDGNPGLVNPTFILFIAIVLVPQTHGTISCISHSSKYLLLLLKSTSFPATYVEHFLTA